MNVYTMDYYSALKYLTLPGYLWMMSQFSSLHTDPTYTLVSSLCRPARLTFWALPYRPRPENTMKHLQQTGLLPGRGLFYTFLAFPCVQEGKESITGGPYATKKQLKGRKTSYRGHFLLELFLYVSTKSQSRTRSLVWSGPVWPAAAEVEHVGPPGGGGDGDVGDGGGGGQQEVRPAVHLQAGLALPAGAVRVREGGGDEEEEVEEEQETAGDGAGHQNRLGEED